MRSSERYEAVHLHRGGRASGGRQQGRHGEGGVRGEDAGAGRSTAQQAQERRGGSPAVTPTPCSLSLPRKPRRPRSRVFDPRHWSPFRFTFALGHSRTGLLSFNFWRVVGGNNEHYNPQRATLKKQLDSTSQRTVPAFPHSRIPEEMTSRLSLWGQTPGAKEPPGCFPFSGPHVNGKVPAGRVPRPGNSGCKDLSPPSPALPFQNTVNHTHRCFQNLITRTM